ncbi:MULTISPECIES: hypothetical protein [unclassified Pseudomonas]|jgi:hypothetical protein|uniref:Uncharacterized protein n=1 Tax=Pseudomonas syringae TaxID=317 RepID=A0A3T0K252_PSESX|nr:MULTISPECIES: hypothetical protein [unclassified Pseudomonas]AZV29756.1 hypothetical protein CT157_28215 [Pseudomonas syringae]
MNNEQVTHQVRHMIGSRYVASVKAYLAELTGRDVRGGTGYLTADLSPGRLTVHLDAQGNIDVIEIDRSNEQKA